MSASSINPRVRVPQSAKRGEIVEIKAVVTHPMENGQRKDAAGKLVPRKIINRFACSFEGREVFAAKLEPSISANPFIAFFLRAERSGTLSFAWTDDDGSVHRLEHKLTVT